MNALNAAMTVIGAGSYGTALAITLARNGHHVVLWGHDPKHIATLQHDRCNAAFLPDVPFPDTLHLESDLATALAASRDILVVVPSHVFGEVLRQIKPLMRPDARLVWATKGLEAETGRLLQDVAREALGDAIPLAVISGPTFAKELAAGLPTAISLAFAVAARATIFPCRLTAITRTLVAPQSRTRITSCFIYNSIDLSVFYIFVVTYKVNLIVINFVNSFYNVSIF